MEQAVTEDTNLVLNEVSIPTKDDYHVDSVVQEAPTKEDAKDIRVEEWKNSLKTRLQQLIMVAADMRNTISTAKTQVKKDYYGKKFKKVNNEVMQLVGMIQQLERLQAAKETNSTETGTNEDTQAVATN